MNDESLEELIRMAAPTQTPETLRVRLARQMQVKAGRASLRHRVFMWSTIATVAASICFVFVGPFQRHSNFRPSLVIQVEGHTPPVLKRTCTLGRSESAGSVMVENNPYQVTRSGEVNIREYEDEKLGKIEVYSYSNFSYEAQPLVIR